MASSKPFSVEVIEQNGGGNVFVRIKIKHPKSKCKLVKFKLPANSSKWRQAPDRINKQNGKPTQDYDVEKIKNVVENTITTIIGNEVSYEKIVELLKDCRQIRKNVLKSLNKQQQNQTQATPSTASENINNGKIADPPIEQVLPHSIFAPEDESANTKAFIAPSFSGKTTFMVMELNRLTDEELNRYDGIFLFTNSPNARPYEHLQKRVLKKIRKFPTFIPSVVRLLNLINQASDNRFKFLVLMDDCLKLRGDLISDLILTMRNNNVSTVISMQYSKLLTPAQRQSIHDFFFFNLKAEDFEYLLSGFIGPHIRDILISEGVSEAQHINYHKLAVLARQRFKDVIIHYDQRKDELHVYQKKQFNISNDSVKQTTRPNEIKMKQN